MLIDGHPMDRVHRVCDLLRSDIAAERERGERELFDLLSLSQLADAAHDALYEAAKRAPHASPPAELPDTDWCSQPVLTARGHHYGRAWRRYRGHVLVVRESGSQRGWFYAAVDGVYLSDLPSAPWAYPSRAQAQAVADDAARDIPPRPVLGIRSDAACYTAPTMEPDL